MLEQDDRHHPLLRRVFGINDAHQRRLAQVEAVVAGIEAPVQLLKDVALSRIQRHRLYHQRRLAPHHLMRTRQAFPDHAGAQNVVTRDDLLQGSAESAQTLDAVEDQPRLQQIRIALFGAQVVIKNAFLQRRQRIDVLHIGRATGHGGDDALDARLIELGQAEHVRDDAGATRRNAVGRHFDFATAAHSGGQCSEGRLIEQHAHVSREVDLAHAFDQAHRQQRMPAQFEEVVVTPDALDVQHVDPDLRQRGFHRTLWRFIFAAEPRALLRLRQGLAVDLAVGGQRQRIETYVCRRQQRIRQACLQMRVQLLNIDRRALGEPRNQPSIANQYHRLPQRRVAAERGFDFTEFDTHATQFDLIVFAPRYSRLPSASQRA